MSNDTPQVRAAHLKILLAALPSLGANEAALVRASIGGLLQRIEDAPRLDWLPAQLLVDLCVAVQATVGDGPLERWGTSALEGVIRSPLGRAFYEAAVLFGKGHPAAVLSGLGQAWRLLYSGCGDFVVTHSEARLVRIDHTPVPQLLRRRATLLPLLGALGAVPALGGFTGSVTAEWQPDSPHFVYHVRW